MENLISLQALMFYGIAVSGAVVHVVKKWSKGEISGSLTSWWTTNRRASVGSVFTIVGGVVAVLASGAVSDVSQAAHVLTVFSIGYIGDSSVNKQ